MKKIKVKNTKIYILIYWILISLIIISIIYVLKYIYTNISLRKELEEESNLLNTIEIDESKLEIVEVNENQKVIEEPIETERMLKVKELKEENQDIVGWLEIEDTNINYPVLQGKDNEYYMTHNYKKQKSKNGSIFLDKDYDWNIKGNNLLMYGHNLNNGTMFQELLKYEKESFYKEHPVIRFTTEKEDSNYEIISVIKTRVYYKNEENVFRYYFFINPKSEKEYSEFITNAKKESLYEINKTANYGDELITLSTCSYHVKDGRFAVIGKKIEN